MSADVAELMQRDPMHFTTEEGGRDLDLIILKLRQARAQYSLGAKSAGNPKKTTKAKAPVGGELDLAALGLIPSSPEEKKE